MHCVDGPGDRRRPVLNGGRRINADDILRGTLGLVDGQHFVDHLVLSEIDLEVRDRRQQRSEYLAGFRVIPGQKCLASVPEILVDVVGLGLADAACSRGELLHVLDEP